MFRVPPSPFHLGKSSFQPVVANPIKLPSRRLSNTSSEPTKPLAREQPLRQDEVISDSEPEGYGNSYHSRDRLSHVVVKSTLNGTVKDGGQHRKEGNERRMRMRIQISRIHCRKRMKKVSLKTHFTRCMIPTHHSIPHE